MALIRYEVNSGTPNITVTLYRNVTEQLGQNVHTQHEEGQFSFTGVAEDDYKIIAVDADGCNYQIPIDYCVCPDETYTAVNNGCVKYEQEAAILREPLEPIFPKSYSNYAQYGSLIFEPGYNIDGTGTYERIDTSNPYWINCNQVACRYATGPLNRSCVWAEHIYPPQDIGFSFCIDLLQTKTYYIGMACDNWSFIKVNGQMVVDQGHAAPNGNLSEALAPLMAMLGQDSRVAFRNWFIYPVELHSGRNVVEVYGHNHTQYLAGFGMEIYDATPNDLKAATSDEDLGDKLLFRSKSLVGQYLDYTYSPSDGYRGYRCNTEGFVLNTCEGDPFCEKRIFIPC